MLYNANAKKTDEANLKLVELETKSFELVRQGKVQEAIQILSGTEDEFRQKYDASVD